MEKDMTTLYLDSMDGGGAAKYLCRPGFIFTNSPAPARGEFERRYSCSEIRDAATQVLRYLAQMTYLDESEIYDAAVLFRKKRQLANVIIDQSFLRKCINKLVFLGAVDARSYVGYNGETDPDYRKAYCLTERGAGLFKMATEYTGYIEEMLICANPTEIMRRLAVNYVLQQMEFRTDATVNYFSAENLEPKKGRRPVYGTIETDREFAVFEPVFYRYNQNIQTEEDLEAHIDERISFLSKYFKKKMAKTEKKRVLVLVVESLDCVKKAFMRYRDVVRDCDLVYITGEAMVRSSISLNLKTAPFLQIANDPEREGNVKLKALTPSFMFRNQKE